MKLQKVLRLSEDLASKINECANDYSKYDENYESLYSKAM